MNRRSRAGFALGLTLMGGLAPFCQGASTDRLETNPTITLHVYNYAHVSPKTLIEAEKIATGIFRKAAVEIRWLDRNGNRKQSSAEAERFQSNDIVLHLLPHSMAEQFALTSERLGFAPGEGPNRTDAYVFYDRTEQLAREQAKMRMKKALIGIKEPAPSIGQILGHVIAHELGHLLGLELHSPTGIMRADWSLADLQEATYGLLAFTPQQADLVRAEVGRRIQLIGRFRNAVADIAGAEQQLISEQRLS
jgi:hypothetical protein